MARGRDRVRETWNKTTSFEHFGIGLTNTRWSWAGKSDDDAEVALVLWQDGVKGRNGDLTYNDTETPTPLGATGRDRSNVLQS